MVSSALLGIDCESIVVAGKCYVIHPPTIKRITGAFHYLSDFDVGNTIADVIRSLSKLDVASKALSWLIRGDDGLAEELSEGTVEEIANGLEKAFSLLSVENFIRLSALTKSVATLIAKPK